jgi:hypothetical protein
VSEDEIDDTEGGEGGGDEAGSVGRFAVTSLNEFAFKSVKAGKPKQQGGQSSDDRDGK